MRHRINWGAVPRYSKKILSDRERAHRLSTASTRALPDFIIAGAQKCGTTSLFNYLSQHPNILPSVIKQVRYYDGGLDPAVDNYELGLDWYRSFFPRKEELVQGRAITGEASPMYLFHPLAAERIRRDLPDVKILITLRNPTARAISHYHHAIRSHEEELPFLDALRAEEERLQPSLQQKDYRSFSFTRHSYKARGIFSPQLDRLYNLFPSENILIVQLEDLSRDAPAELRRVFEFLGVDSDVRIGDISAKGTGNNSKKPDHQTVEYLNEYFAEPNAVLHEKYDVKFT